MCTMSDQEYKNMINQNIIKIMIAFPIICFILFHYIRRNNGFKMMVIISLVASIVLYFTSYPLPLAWPY